MFYIFKITVQQWRSRDGENVPSFPRTEILATPLLYNSIFIIIKRKRATRVSRRVLKDYELSKRNCRKEYIECGLRG